jgi:signal transduction histidine kinase
MPTVSIAWVFAFHQWIGTRVSTPAAIWCLCALAYALCSAIYRIHLKHHPAGGVHAQYAFLALDPLIVGGALLAAPEALAWWLVLMLVIVARVGFRYGLNAMKFELAFAWIGASLPLLFSVYWQTQFQMAASLVLMLISSWWMFAPLNRLLGRAKQLDIDNARVQSMQESLRAKSEFLSRVSHELKSPLQGVVSALDLIEERHEHDPADTELIARVRRGATALNTQLRDLLTLARGDVGKIEINPMPFEAGELVMSVAREVQNEAWSKGLALVVKTPEDAIFIVADAGRIDQVLTNLLTNAIRHTKRGSVTLTLHPYDGRRARPPIRRHGHRDGGE